LVDKILKFQTDHVDSKKYVTFNGKRLQTNKHDADGATTGEVSS
jgi:hypothetical protein